MSERWILTLTDDSVFYDIIECIESDIEGLLEFYTFEKHTILVAKIFFKSLTPMK